MLYTGRGKQKGHRVPWDTWGRKVGGQGEKKKEKVTVTGQIHADLSLQMKYNYLDPFLIMILIIYISIHLSKSF